MEKENILDMKMVLNSNLVYKVLVIVFCLVVFATAIVIVAQQNNNSKNTNNLPIVSNRKQTLNLVTNNMRFVII